MSRIGRPTMAFLVFLSIFSGIGGGRAGDRKDETEPPPSGASVAAGKALFNSVGCWACHGFSGQGGAGTAPQIGPEVLPRDAFLYQLRHPSNVMPPYGTAVLTDEQIGSIFDYLRSLPVPPQVQDVPLLK